VFYRRWIFPYLLEATTRVSGLNRLREATLRDVWGNILEVGFGTGASLAHYPPRVASLTAVDVNPGVRRLARRRIARWPIRVELRIAEGDRLPFSDGEFETVVSTCTLCSARDPSRLLREIRRVLRPGGRYLFLEHGLSDDERVRRWQRLWNPLQRTVADNCHVTREIRQLISREGFEFFHIREFHADGLPRVLGFFSQGIAVRA
jgi:ubiquinone/menaquinone biosynthesis C-methylase UbiE